MILIQTHQSQNMAGNPAIILLVVAVIAAIVLAVVITDITTHKSGGFVHKGPSPEARAVHTALVELGGPATFNCNIFKLQLGDMLEEKQVARLCRDGNAILDGPISECLCGSMTPEVESEEDPLVLVALEDLGYQCDVVEVEGQGNVTVRTGEFDVTMCRMRLCDGNSCPDLLALQDHLCDKDGDPRYTSNTAECVCLEAPVSPPPPCSPGLVLPVVWNETLAGTLTISQTNASITVNVTTPDLCFQQPRVYIGAVRAPAHPQFPRLPGNFPTETWEQEIGVSMSGPARFSLADLDMFPPEWNHPGAPTFECGHDLYLQWAALASQRLPNGLCPSPMHPSGWVPAASDPAAFTYAFCCQ